MGNYISKSRKKKIINSTLIDNKIFCTNCNIFHDPFLKYCKFCERCQKIYNFHCYKCNKCYNIFDNNKCNNCFKEKTYYCYICKLSGIRESDDHYCRKHSI